MRPYLILLGKIKIIGGVSFTFTDGGINHAADIRQSALRQKRGHEGKFTIRSSNRTGGRGCATHRISSR